jgi:divinyl protochlorophyllide a 8-vinyl-reductase
MIPEGDAARLHNRLRLEFPSRAPDLARAAGFATGDYILAHRIPKSAQQVLSLLPAPLAARALSTAIARHAWTFAGSGAFRVVDPWTFEIDDNPLVRGEHGLAPLCHWHAAVFERLYATLVHRDVRCVETRCGAQPGSHVCRFEVVRRPRSD